MTTKILATALFLSGILVATSSADPGHKRFKDVRKSERRIVAVPEPGTLLLTAFGFGAVLMADAWIRRRR